MVQNENYAHVHAYTYHVDDTDYSSQLPPPLAINFGKVLSLRRFLPLYDAVLIIDADCVIYDMDMRIETILDTNPTASVIVSNYAPKGRLWVNSAAILIRNDDFGRGMIQEWLNAGKTTLW